VTDSERHGDPHDSTAGRRICTKATEMTMPL
jgi:hypothetical protein